MVTFSAAHHFLTFLWLCLKFSVKSHKTHWKGLGSGWIEIKKLFQTNIFYNFFENLKKRLIRQFSEKNQHFHEKLVFDLFSLIFVILLGQMHKNMQNNCYLNGRIYKWAKSRPISKFVFSCMSGIVLCTVRESKSCVKGGKLLQPNQCEYWKKFLV